MKPRAFTYHRPRSYGEVTEVLRTHGADARILAGGQGLLPLLNMRSAHADHLIDINWLTDAERVRVSGDLLAFGPLVRLRAVERSPEVQEHAPLIDEAVRITGNPTVRNRATLCGNVAYANPASQLSAALLAMDGEVRALSHAGDRSLPLRSFFAGPFAHALAPDEWVVELRVRRRVPGAGFGLANVARQGTPIVTAAVTMEVTDDIISRLAIAVSGAARAAYRAGHAERALIGEQPTPAAIRAAAALAVIDDAVSDVNASAGYRRHIAEVLVRRSLQTAVERAGRTRQ